VASPVGWLAVEKAIHGLFPLDRPQETPRVSWVDGHRILLGQTCLTFCWGAAARLSAAVTGRYSPPLFLGTRIAPMSPRTVLVVILAAGLGAGCRLVQRRGPVPPELADARRLCNEGLSAVDRNDLVRAEGLLDRAVKSCPLVIDARRHYAEVLWKRGQRMEAVGQIAEALKLSPGDVGLSIDGGRMYMELGLLEDADRLARDAVRMAPRSADAWRLRGQVAMARGQAEQALGDFHLALALAPEDRETLRDTAEAYRRLGRPQRALATLAILGEQYGPSQTPADVLLLEGMAQEALGRTTDALDSYRRAVAKGNAPPEAAARLAALEQGGGVVR
jgi:tetratricopeptide (TPR) repeat protein